ncbi:serine hydrolase domain-containing protein [Actinomycetospora sp. OC33-EN08]|uniref:Serine hydrolase domain-containing protein n=1 Tax=Actinomycetospora aurantiaca TaxID=3129233 RepID=A0ABU8MT91_9PSEU
MTSVRGICDSRFDRVGQALQRNIDDGAEVGASVVVDIDGHRSVDLWGGFRDVEHNSPWEMHTITNLWSCTKMVTALAALLLVDRGELALDAPVAKYWPEFADNGKSDVEVRHLLSHTSGVSGLEQPATLEDFYDARGTAARLAGQRPWWTPGTASGYHVLTYGHLIGELVARISGVSLTRFVDQEIARPLDADFQIGAAAADWPRIAPVIAPVVAPMPDADIDPGVAAPDSPAARTFAVGATPEDANTGAWRRAELGAVNGHGNARALANLLSVIARGGESDGARLLRRPTIDRVLEPQADGVDLVLGIPLRWGIGFGLPCPQTLPWIPDGRVCFWGGWGGSMVVMDLDRRMTISYVMNKMSAGIIGSPRSAEYVTAVYDALES